jgi:hypothetical protein
VARWGARIGPSPGPTGETATGGSRELTTLLSGAPPPERHRSRTARGALTAGRTIARWLAAGPDDRAAAPHVTYPWWQVVCLTGVDYFSTLGYQPGIAALAAGLLAPVATAILVLVTLAVALPVYLQVAARSPHGQGSIVMLEEHLPRWRGKLGVLVLLGFAFTDFIITITLSAADATAHVVENPYVPAWMDHRLGLTLLLVAILGAVFLKGLREAIGLAVVIVVAYLALNAVVLVAAARAILADPALLGRWWTAAHGAHGHPLGMVAVAVLVFPRLALGLSGFETGVAVMPLVRGSATDTPEAPVQRIRNTRKLLVTAALIMSVFLLGSSVATTVLIPPDAFQKGGAANGRALAYLAHERLGHAFGTAYDVSTIAILWFAGASAMAALLNLVPRYLPPYGMAPEWARAARPLVVVFTLVNAAVTLWFDADVDAQGGAYATGVLFLMSSAALAVTIASWRDRGRLAYLAMTLVFAYTTVANIVERPDGFKIASLFIVAIVATSLTSRAVRSTELRIGAVRLADRARAFIEEVGPDPVRIIAHRPDKRSVEEYDRKARQAREDHGLGPEEPLVFLEVTHGDASTFTGDLDVRGVQVGRHRILRCQSPAVPNAIAAILIHVRDLTGRNPHAYFGWTEGNPVLYALRYVALGEGDTAPLTREVLRKTIPRPLDRPHIHVG